MATLLKVLNNLADIKSAGSVALRVRTQDYPLLARRGYSDRRHEPPFGHHSTMGLKFIEEFDLQSDTGHIAILLHPARWSPMN
jgi:hypothetical protein